jgi:hypothetical protein
MRRRLGWIVSAVLAAATAAMAESNTADSGGEPAPGSNTARGGAALAAAAADAWADDARLVWIENEDALDERGRAAAWGYLYYSREKHAMRSWSVREARIDRAADHAVSAEAVALDPEWKDSAEIVERAWQGGGREFCASGGTLSHLVLVRGVFASESSWCAVFDNGAGPDLFILLDATSGDVKKRWRG